MPLLTSYTATPAELNIHCRSHFGSSMLACCIKSSTHTSRHGFTCFTRFDFMDGRTGYGTDSDDMTSDREVVTAADVIAHDPPIGSVATRRRAGLRMSARARGIVNVLKLLTQLSSAAVAILGPLRETDTSRNRQQHVGWQSTLCTSSS